MHNLLLPISKWSPLKLLNEILEKYLRKGSFLVKFQVLKTNSFTHIFQGFPKSLITLLMNNTKDSYAIHSTCQIIKGKPFVPKQKQAITSKNDKVLQL